MEKVRLPDFCYYPSDPDRAIPTCFGLADKLSKREKLTQESFYKKDTNNCSNLSTSHSSSRVATHLSGMNAKKTTSTENINDFSQELREIKCEQSYVYYSNGYDLSKQIILQIKQDKALQETQTSYK